MAPETKERWMKALSYGLDRWGMPTVYLGVATYLGVQLATWCGANVVVPMVNSTMAVHAELVALSKEQNTLLSRLVSIEENQGRMLQNIESRLNKLELAAGR